jgi:hypothetical protein
MTSVGTYIARYAVPRGTSTVTDRYTDSETGAPAAIVTADLAL